MILDRVKEDIKINEGNLNKEIKDYYKKVKSDKEIKVNIIKNLRTTLKGL